VLRSACIDQRWILQPVHTIKLVATSQSSTAATTEDAFSIAQCAHVRATGLTQAVFVGEGDDSATYTGSDARDALRQVAFELVRTGCTSAVERQGDSRAFGIGWSVGLLARVLGFRGESDVEAGNEVGSSGRVRAGLGQAGCQVVESMGSAESGSDLSQTCLL
jgi:hypothetical protein